MFDISLPEGYVLDGQVPAANFSCDFATYTSKTELKGNVLHYVRSLQIQKVHVPRENLALKYTGMQVSAESRLLMERMTNPEVSE